MLGCLRTLNGEFGTVLSLSELTACSAGVYSLIALLEVLDSDQI